MVSEKTKIKLYQGSQELIGKLQDIFSRKENIDVEEINEINQGKLEDTNILMVLSEENSEDILKEYGKTKVYIVVYNGDAFYCYNNGIIDMSILNKNEEKCVNIILDQYYTCRNN